MIVSLTNDVCCWKWIYYNVMKGMIPTRPENDSDFPVNKDSSYGLQTKRDKDCIVYAVAFGIPNDVAFARFHPEYVSEGKLNEEGIDHCKQFFKYARNREFADAYRETLKKSLALEVSDTVELSDSRKEKALKILLDKTIRLVEGGAELDPDTLKTVSEVFKKVGLLKDDVEQDIHPLRFLPVRCFGDGCRYRLFVESMVLEGSAIDECQYCKALKFAQDNGFRYNPQSNLDIPEDVVKRLEGKNNVNLLDIINGKIEN